VKTFLTNFVGNCTLVPKSNPKIEKPEQLLKGCKKGEKNFNFFEKIFKKGLRS
jgi:hypothetical protein